MLKGPVKAVSISMIYIAVLVLAYFLLWTPLSEADRLSYLIIDAEQEQSIFNLLISRRPSLLNEVAAKEEKIRETKSLVPSASDLPVVLTVIKDLAAEADEIKLEYYTLRTADGESWYPLTLEMSGHIGSLVTVLAGITANLPSVTIDNVHLTSDAESGVDLYANLSLYVIPDDQDPDHYWAVPVPLQSGTVTKNPEAFGIPLAVIDQFSTDEVSVLGIITASGDQRALISFNNSLQWLKVGDYIGPARIVDITNSLVILNLSGIEIQLSLGGRSS